MSSAAAAFVALAVGHATHEAKMKAMKVVELRAICMDFGLESTGDKAALMDRVRTHKLAAGGGGGGGGGGSGGGGGGGPPPPPVVPPDTPGALEAMTDADLRMV